MEKISVLLKISRYFASLPLNFPTKKYIFLVKLHMHESLLSFFSQAKVVTPHLKHAFDNLCNANIDDSKQKPASSKLSILFGWLFGSSQDTEL